MIHDGTLPMMRARLRSQCRLADETLVGQSAGPWLHGRGAKVRWVRLIRTPDPKSVPTASSVPRVRAQTSQGAALGVQKKPGARAPASLTRELRIRAVRW